jgi:hypothetical protein
MEKAGDGKYRIYEETGFWKGPEGDWRFEIDDTDIKFKPEALKSFEEIMQQELLIGAPGDVERLKRVRYAPITDVVEHPELFEAYPELKEYYIKVDPEGEYRGGGFGGMAAGYQQGRGETVPLPDGTDGTRPVIMLMAPTRDNEIKRLKDLIPRRESLLKGQQDELNNILDSTSDEYKALLKDVTANEKALAGMMERLQALEAGGQPDIPFSVKSTLTHELQHAVQDIENLPRGGSPAAAELQTEIAIKQLAEQTGKSLSQIRQDVGLRNYKIAQIAALDKILYLQFLQRYINSDNPTRSARLINNSSLNYEITAGERDWLGPPPNRRNIPKYGAYLRRKAELYQAKVIDNIIKREEHPDGFYNVYADALSEVKRYEERRGKVDLSNIKRDDFHPKNVGTIEFYNQRKMGNRALANPDELTHPNYAAIPENVLKNAIKRLSREADQYLGEQKVLNKVEDATKRLERLKRDNPFDYSTELYYRLAGEAEARAVQSRFERATALSNFRKDFEIYETDNGFFKIKGGPSEISDIDFESRKDAQRFLDNELGYEDRIPTAMKDYGGAYDRDPEDLAFYYPRDQVPSVPAAAAINVPKSDVGFTSPALRVIMESNREQLPKEQWLKFLKGNGVKDDELEFSGLGEWLKQQKGQVSRADLEEYMTTQNQLKIEEVVYGGMDEDVMVMKYIEEMTSRSDTLRIGDLPEFEDDITREVKGLVQDWRDGYTLTSELTMSPMDLETKLPIILSEEQKAREVIENAVRDFHVVVDENGEFMRNTGGDISFFRNQNRADQEIEFAAESDARTMSQEQLREALNIEGDEKAFGPVKYPQADLSLPGQRDEYRELVLYWDKPGEPSMPKGFSVKEVPTGSGKFTIVDEDGSIVDRTSYDTEAEAIEAFNKFFEIEKGTESIWMGSHNYTDKPNPLLHIRFSERRDSAGERILVIEEIQSDIAKRGQKEGFRPKGFVETNEKIKALELELQENQKQIEELREYAAFTQNQQNQYDDLIARGTDIDNQIETERLASIDLPQGTKIQRIYRVNGKPVKEPNIPEDKVMYQVDPPEKIADRETFFGMTQQEAIDNTKYFIREKSAKSLDRGPFIMDTKDYMELGLKRMILWASENGFEKIAWTTGEQQMKRYNQLVEGIQKLSVQRKTGPDFIDKESDTFRVLGRGSNDENFDSGDITRKQLDDYLGERTAEKVVKDMDAVENPQININISGQSYEYLEVPVDDLKLPKDPRHFLMIAYDKVLKNAAQKLGKKYDAKVGVGDLTVEEAPMVKLPGQENVPDAQVKYGMGKPIQEKVWTLNLSEKLKSAAEKGLPYMAVVPPAAMMMNQEQDRTPINRAAARPIMENYAN